MHIDEFLNLGVVRKLRESEEVEITKPLIFELHRVSQNSVENCIGT